MARWVRWAAPNDRLPVCRLFNSRQQLMSVLSRIERTPLEVLSQTEQCVVCGDSADGFHYGVRSCRGCNAFFRRAVTYDQRFVCRRGGHCPVDRTARCACRACRLAKCIAVGMDKKAVQSKRDGPTNEHSPGAFYSTYSAGKQRRNVFYIPKHENGPESSALRPHSTSTFNSVLTHNLYDTENLVLPNAPSSPLASVGLIARQCYEYEDQKKRRRAMLCRSLEEILINEYDPGLRRIATVEDYVDLFHVQMVLMFEWAEKLPEFCLLLDPMDKARLLRAFSLHYLLLDNLFHTMELGFEDRIVFVNNNYVKPLESCEENKGLLTEGAAGLMMYGAEARAVLEDLVIPMKRMGLKVGEMMTLRMIMFWNPGNVGLTLSGIEVARTASNNAVKELHRYFEGEGIADVEHRIGSLLLLLPAFAKHVHYLYEIVKLVPSLGKMNECDSFVDVFLNGL
uniref:Zinc finger, C4 type n=1 Tax=Haemonchus contortus TaxID=6289 RepID=A0A7I4Z3A1_HAECO